MRVKLESFRAAIALLAAACLLAGGPASAQSIADAPPNTADYFIYGPIVLSGILLALLLRQSGRIRDLHGDLADRKRSAAIRDAVLSAGPVATLYFEPSGRVAGRDAALRTSPGLGGLLAPDAPERLTVDDVLSVFETESGERLGGVIDALRQDGTSFSEALRHRDDIRSFTAIGNRIEAGGNGVTVDVVWFEDTTELTTLRDEVKAEASERRLLESVSGLLDMPVWRRDRELTVIYRNPAAESLMADDDRSEQTAGRAQRVGARQTESGYVVVDGDRRLFEFVEWPMPDGSGTVGWAHDVTALEETQAELASLVATHEEVLEELTTGITIFGPDRRLIYFNTAFARLWQIEAERLRNEPTVSEFLDLLREHRRLPEQSDFAAFRDQWNRMFTSLIGPREELLFLPDETTLRMLVAAHPNGGLLLTFEDVTDRLALERSYNILNAVQRETIDNLYDALAVFGGDGRLRLMNPRFSLLWGLPDDLSDSEPHLNDVLELMQPQFREQPDWPAFKEAFANRLADRAGENGRIERRDGTVLDFAFVPLPDGATLINYSDVTDSINVQRALQERAEALEHADRLKSEFIANVSYELRTPLNAIIGFSELLRMQVGGPMNARQLDYAQSILDSSNRLVTLVNDILDLASIEAGYLELEPDDMEVSVLVRDLEQLAHERSRAKRIEFLVEVDPEVVTVRADPRRLKQALFNVVSNALNFTRQDGDISLVVRRDQGGTLFVISDTGVGIPAHMQNRIFESFEQGGQQRRSAGAGLGLALVRRLVELHGGTVDIVSRVDVGTTVTCRLPDPVTFFKTDPAPEKTVT